MVDVIPDNSWGDRANNYRRLANPKRITAAPKPSVDIDSLLGSMNSAPRVNVRDYLSGGNPIGAGGPKEEEESDDQAWYETPVVQGIIDLISVGGYATANVASEFQDSGDMFEEGDFLGGLGNALIAPAKGVFQGIQGAVGVEDQQTTWSDVIDRGIEDAGLDNDNKASNTAEAVGGFAGDVLLDPLTYASLGLFPLAKGAITGAAKAGRASKLIAEGDEIADQTTSKLTGAKQGASSEYTAYRKGIKDQRQMRKDKRTIKKNRGTNEEIEAAIERVAGYKKPDWDMKALEAGKSIPKAEKAREAIDELVETAAPSIDETLLNTPAPRSAYPRNIPDAEKKVKPSDIVKDIPAETKIADYAKFTPVDRFVLGLEDFATTVPKYTRQQMEDINKITAATPAMVENVITPQKLDTGRLATSLSRLKRRFEDKDGKIVSSAKMATDIRKGGKTAQAAIARLPEAMKKKFEIAPAVTETVPNPLGIPEAELLAAGAKAEDILDIQINNGVSSDAFRISAGSRYPALLAAMRNGEYDGTESLAKFKTFFEDFTGQRFTDSASLAKAAGKYFKNNKEAVSESTKSFKPTNLGVGHMAKGDGTKQPSVAMMRFVLDRDPENVNAYRRGISAQTAEELSEDYLNEVKQSIQENPFAKEIAEGAAEIFKKTYNKQKTPSGPFRTNKGWSKADQKLISGEPKKEYWWTTATFIDQYREVAAQTSKILSTKGKNLKGKERLEMRDKINMQMFAYIDAEIKSFGIFPYLTNVMPENSFLVRLSGFDVLNAMGPAMRQKYIFTEKGDINNLRVTMVMDVAETLMRSVSDIGYEGQVNYAKIQPKVLQVLMGKFRESEVARVIDENLDISTQKFNESIIEANVKLGKKYDDATAERMNVFQNVYKEFTDGEEIVGKLAVKLMENTARSAAKLTGEIVETVAGTYTKMDNAIAQGSVGNAIEILTEIPPKLIDPAGNTVMKSEIDRVKSEYATPKERQVAGISAKTAAIFNNRVKTNVSDGSKFDKNGVPLSQSWGKNSDNKPLPQQAQVNANNAETAKIATNVALKESNLKESASRMPAEQLIDLDRKDLAWQTVTRFMGLQKFFNPRFGANKSYDALTSGIHLVTHLQSNFHDGVLNNIMKKGYTPEQVRLGFKAAQDGDYSSQVAKDFKQVMDYMFDESKNNFFTRNGVGPKHMKNIMDGMKVNDAWRFDPDGGPEAMSQAWRKWTNIENPIKALEVIHSAMIKASMDISMGAQYSAHFGRKSINSFPKSEQRNWAKVKPDSNNAFAQLIDTDLYYPKEIIDELPALGRIITESRSFEQGSWLKRWSEGVFDPITSALKLTQTTMRPGHHVMSVLGDLMRNSLAGMDVSTKEYKQMWRIIRSRQQTTREMSGFDQYARIKGVSSEVLVNGGKSAKGEKADSMTLIIGGKEKDVSYDSLFQLMEQKDIILPAHVGGVPEDILYDFSTSFDASQFSPAFQRTAKVADTIGRKTNDLANNRFIGLSKFSAERDNLMRGALALHFMQSRRFSSVEDAINYASVQLKKWAPTAQDLSAAESKTARRVMFYYTWMRGIFPRIVESVMNRPGMSTVPSKAMYNLAVANGLDPQSFGNPFPEEGDEPKYPSWYADGVLGPQWKDDEGYEWGFNPTSPVLDIFNSLGSGATAGDIFNPDANQNTVSRITKTLLGMMNPAFKAVPELGTGSSMSTGAPIWDTSEYFTDMVGPVRTASRITGHNLALDPNAMFAPRRTESKYAEGLGTPEEWRANAGTELLNWATGLGFTNYTADSAVTSAQFAEREQNRNEERYENRTEWWK